MNKRAWAGAAVVTVLWAAAVAGESFRTVRTAGFGEVLRGVSFTPRR